MFVLLWKEIKKTKYVFTISFTYKERKNDQIPVGVVDLRKTKRNLFEYEHKKNQPHFEIATVIIHSRKT